MHNRTKESPKLRQRYVVALAVGLAAFVIMWIGIGIIVSRVPAGQNFMQSGKAQVWRTLLAANVVAWLWIVLLYRWRAIGTTCHEPKCRVYLVTCAFALALPFATRVIQSKFPILFINLPNLEAAIGNPAQCLLIGAAFIGWLVALFPLRTIYEAVVEIEESGSPKQLEPVQRRLYLALVVLSGMLMLATITTAFLRKAIIATSSQDTFLPVHKALFGIKSPIDSYPPELVAIYGLYYTAFIAVVFVPVQVSLRGKFPGMVKTEDKRKALGLEANDFYAAIAILSPLVTGVLGIVADK